MDKTEINCKFTLYLKCDKSLNNKYQRTCFKHRISFLQHKIIKEWRKQMPKQNIEYIVTRSFDSNNISLLENLIEYIEENEVIEDDDCKPPDSNCRNLLQTI